MGAHEKIYQLVKQWSSDIDWEQATKALCEIALVAVCISPEEAIAAQVNETQYMSASEWLQSKLSQCLLMGYRTALHRASSSNMGNSSAQSKVSFSFISVNAKKPKLIASKAQSPKFMVVSGLKLCY